MYQARQDVLKAQRPFDIGYSTPKEGAVLAIDSMVLHGSGKRPDLAHRFIDFMLEGRNSADLTNLIGSGNPNAEAMQHIRDELRTHPAVFPDAEGRRRLEMVTDHDRRTRRLMNRMWIEIKVR